MVEGKKKFSCFMLVWDHVVCVFMNIFGLLLKTEITLYGTTLSFIMNLLPFCMSIILVWCVECLVVWRLCKRAITSVIKYKYNTNAIQLQCKNINITIHYNIPKWHNIEFFFTKLTFLGYHVVFLSWSMFWSNLASQNYKKTTKIHYCNFNTWSCWW